jgi:catechol 2,3-dioxygenase-like lactoylglutathione lyase family enzyme
MIKESPLQNRFKLMGIEIHPIAANASDITDTISFYSKMLSLKVIHKPSPFQGPKVRHYYWHEELDHFITFYHCPSLGVAKPGANYRGELNRINGEIKPVRGLTLAKGANRLNYPDYYKV